MKGPTCKTMAFEEQSSGLRQGLSVGRNLTKRAALACRRSPRTFGSDRPRDISGQDRQEKEAIQRAENEGMPTPAIPVLVPDRDRPATRGRDD